MKKSNVAQSFNLKHVSTKDIVKEINNLDPTKASQYSDIPTKILKDNADIFAQILSNSINHTFDSSEFPSGLKSADISPIFKKNDRTNKTNKYSTKYFKNI